MSIMHYLYGEIHGGPLMNCTTFLYYVLVPCYSLWKQQIELDDPFWSRLNMFYFCISKFTDQSKISVLQTSEFIQLPRFCDLTPAPSITISDLPVQTIWYVLLPFTPQLWHLALWRTSWAVVSPPTITIRLATSSIVWCLHRPQVMLSWCCGMVESLVIGES